MKIFSIYAKNGEQNDLAVVGEGLSQWALIFGPFWAFYNRMWLFGAMTLVIASVSGLLHSYFPTYLSWYIGHLIMLIYWFFAHDLMSYKLIKNDYQLQDVIVAASAEEAELNYLRKNAGLKK